MNSVLYKIVHDGTESEGFEEGEVVRLREAGAVNAVIYHSEIERRIEDTLTGVAVAVVVHDVIGTVVVIGGGDGVDYTMVDIPMLFVVMLEMEFFNFHISIGNNNRQSH